MGALLIQCLGGRVWEWYHEHLWSQRSRDGRVLKGSRGVLAVDIAHRGLHGSLRRCLTPGLALSDSLRLRLRLRLPETKLRLACLQGLVRLEELVVELKLL